MEAKIKTMIERINWSLEDAEPMVTQELKNIQKQLNRIQKYPDDTNDAIVWIENATKNLVRAQSKVIRLKQERRMLEQLLK